MLIHYILYEAAFKLQELGDCDREAIKTKYLLSFDLALYRKSLLNPDLDDHQLVQTF